MLVVVGTKLQTMVRSLARSFVSQIVEFLNPVELLQLLLLQLVLLGYSPKLSHVSFFKRFSFNTKLTGIGASGVV